MKETIKRLMLLAAVVTMAVGCASQGGPSQEQTCESAKLAYATYQAVLAASEQPSRDQILAAATAGAFLQAYCGWVVPVTKARGQQAVVADANGVLILAPPTR